MIEIQNKNIWKHDSGRFLLGVIFLVSLLFLFFELPVEGHSSIEKSSPEAKSKLEDPPEKIDIWFADTVNVHGESFIVTNEEGEEMNIASPFKNQENQRHITIPIKDKLPPGQYTVDIEVIGSDGHPLRETYDFEIATPKNQVKEGLENLSLKASNPEDGAIIASSPNQIELWLSQPADISAFALYNDKQSLIKTGEPEVDPEDPTHYTIEVEETLDRGTHSVDWYASVEEGSKNGTFYFAVGEVTSFASENGDAISIPSLSLEKASTSLKYWLAFTGLLTLFGGTWFKVFIAKGKGRGKSWEKTSIALYVVSITGLMLLLIQYRTEFSQLSWKEFFLLPFIWVTGLQMILLVSAFWVKKSKPLSHLALLGVAVVLWSFTGHSVSSYHNLLWGVGLDALHLFGVSIWMGGLVGLIILSPREEKVTWLKTTGLSYAKWAFFSILLIIITGVLMTVEYIPSFTFSSLISSEWGMVLGIKVSLVLVILAFAIGQRLSLKHLSASSIFLFFFRARMEVAVGVLLLFAAAILIELQPKEAEQGIYPSMAEKEDVEVSVDVEPFRIGKNDITIQFEEESEFEEVRASFFMFPSWNIEHTAFPLGNGAYRLTGNFIHGAGTIQMTVKAVKKNGETVSIPFRIQAPGKMATDYTEEQ
ncbi:copper resistance CopC/CopD family protein [Alteribacillus bidgolensis]|uniref:Putative copper export protein n=1 Tax=Alteribacillus bidgolensis TaxID=930129 RepID=A0A1G8R8X2_9BACI|nr:copper resistance protein CopC [Alteribacillus bidgolensis]SDJ12830.1 Putative copper export protein [Alteribacillus bidgolensis]